MATNYDLGQFNPGDEMRFGQLEVIIEKCGVSGPSSSSLRSAPPKFDDWTCIAPITLHGNRLSRALFYGAPHARAPKAQALLTMIHWHFVIINEDHRLKNTRSKMVGLMMSLHVEHVLLMTGARIQYFSSDEIFAPALFWSLEESRSLRRTSRALTTWRSCKECDVEALLTAKGDTN
jgi:hypothetical protein